MTSDQLFDWAEREYSAFFPSHEPTQRLSPYEFRHYKGTNNYLGVANGRVFVLGAVSGNQILDVGSVDSFRCRAQPVVCRTTVSTLSSGATQVRYPSGELITDLPATATSPRQLALTGADVKTRIYLTSDGNFDRAVDEQQGTTLYIRQKLDTAVGYDHLIFDRVGGFVGGVSIWNDHGTWMAARITGQLGAATDAPLMYGTAAALPAGLQAFLNQSRASSTSSPLRTWRPFAGVVFDGLLGGIVIAAGVIAAPEIGFAAVTVGVATGTVILAKSIPRMIETGIVALATNGDNEATLAASYSDGADRRSLLTRVRETVASMAGNATAQLKSWTERRADVEVSTTTADALPAYQAVPTTSPSVPPVQSSTVSRRYLLGISPAAPSAIVGTPLTLHAALQDQDFGGVNVSTATPVSWVSSDLRIASIGLVSGILVPLSPGKITVTAYDSTTQLVAVSTVTVSLAPPVVSSVTPLTAVLNQTTTYTVTGVNLIDGMRFLMEGCSGVEVPGIGTPTRRQFVCTSGLSGINRGEVRDQVDGVVLGTFSVNVTAPIVPAVICTGISPTYPFRKYCYYIAANGQETYHGLLEYYASAAGALVQRETYVDGVLNGPAEYYSAFKGTYYLSREGAYVNRNESGIWKYYWTSDSAGIEGLGKLQFETTYGIYQGSTVAVLEKRYCPYNSLLPSRRGQLDSTMTFDTSTGLRSYQATSSCNFL